MKRLLCILSNMNAGGAETFLMKLYRRLDKMQYQMDFCINQAGKCYYENEILEMGGKIYRIPEKSKNLKEFQSQLYRVVQENKYENVLRITSNAMGFLDLMIAKKAGAKVCAARSSNSSDGDGWKVWLAHRLGRMLLARYVDVKFAPSDLAAKYTFGARSYKAGECKILPNAVDLNVFCYDSMGRQQIRKELGIDPDILLVGHVGRFDAQKNHMYLLNVFVEILKRNPSSRLLLVGCGTLEGKIRQEASRLGIAERVIFAGVRSEIPQILSAMDVFVFPSLYEGMPNTVIEAQATGLPCVIADTITREADITGLVRYMSLQDSPELWAQAALDAVSPQRKNTKQAFLDHKYDIQSTVDQFVQLCFGE